MRLRIRQIFYRFASGITGGGGGGTGTPLTIDSLPLTIDGLPLTIA